MEPWVRAMSGRRSQSWTVERMPAKGLRTAGAYRLNAVLILPETVPRLFEDRFGFFGRRIVVSGRPRVRPGGEGMSRKPVEPGVQIKPALPPLIVSEDAAGNRAEFLIESP